MYSRFIANFNFTIIGLLFFLVHAYKNKFLNFVAHLVVGKLTDCAVILGFSYVYYLNFYDMVFWYISIFRV